MKKGRPCIRPPFTQLYRHAGDSSDIPGSPLSSMDQYPEYRHEHHHSNGEPDARTPICTGGVPDESTESAADQG